jgi:hypothetical protein
VEESQIAEILDLLAQSLDAFAAQADLPTA